tara:strand:+ start:4535 stop:5083 length:549 start_codon:yes stop_codon:yes gene_type:complete
MIKGDKVGLRALEKEDLILLKDWRNIPGFRKNFREVRELSLTDQEEWYKSLQQTKHINFMFIIVDIKSKEPIGAAGLLYVNWTIRSADFSFYIGKDELYIGDDGAAKEATELLITYGFNNLNLNKIWMELYEYDHQKFSFFTEKFNFINDGVLRENCFEGGKYWNSNILSLLRRDAKIYSQD